MLEVAAFGKDLVEESRNGRLSQVVGRRAEVDRVIRILTRKTKNNPILVGDPGVGKTAVAEGLAHRVVSGDVPAWMGDACILSVDTGKLIEKSNVRGGFESLMRSLIDFVSRDDMFVILFVDEIHAFFEAGKGEGGLSAGEMLKPELARGALRCLGATTIDEYRRLIEPDEALERRCGVVRVDEPSRSQTLEILKGLRPGFEDFHHVAISDGALEAAVDLGNRYLLDRKQPDKAVDVIDETCAAVRIHCFQHADLSFGHQREKSSASGNVDDEIARLELLLAKAEEEFDLEAVADLGHVRLPALKKQRSEAASSESAKPKAIPRRREVTAVDVASVVSDFSGIPRHVVMPRSGDSDSDLEQRIRARIVGQDRAVEAIASAILAGRTEAAEGRPCASFQLFGPSGVGKSAICAAIAAEAFGNESAVIEWDLSKYEGKGGVYKLLGPPPGFAEHQHGGELVAELRRRPFSVVVFSNLGQADREVVNIVKKACKTGVVSDSLGRSADFRNCVIVATERIHSDAVDEFVDATLELLPLERDSKRLIAQRMLSALAGNLSVFGVELSYGENVVEALSSRKGIDDDEGAWPLHRSCRRELEVPLLLARKAALERGCGIELRVEDEGFFWGLK